VGLSSLRDERIRVLASHCLGKVIDIGCGPNNYFIKNSIKNTDSLGIDCYPYEGVEILVDDMENLPYSNDSFDTVSLNVVGGHIPKSKRKSKFREFSRILKKGGKLILT